MAPPHSEVDLVPVSDVNAIIVPDPLTVNGITSRRAKGLKLPGTIAALSSSDSYKSMKTKGKPLAKRWDHILSPESASREPSHLKDAAKYLKTPGIISLGGGLPSSQYFPLDSIDIKIPDVGKFSEADIQTSGVHASTGKYDVSRGIGDYDLSIAMNYGQGMGGPPMIRFVTEHTELVHHPPYEDWGCSMTVGNSSALDMAYRMFTQRGDFFLTEEYTFVSAVDTATPMGLRAIGVRMDPEGLLPSDMDDIMTNWDVSVRGSSKPRLLYTVPSGQNPTGATQSFERRKELYKVAQKHDLYILEDEPYYFLQMQPYTGQDTPSVPPPASHEEFLACLVPSLLSLDTDGRVMRMDSFSKIIAPGMRTGWITASKQIVERFVRHNESSIQSPAGLSQVVLHKILDESWGHGGFLDWLLHLRMQYTARRDAILGACEKHLPTECVSWITPMAGMFLWMEIDYHKHPQASTQSLKQIEDTLFHAAVGSGVLVLPGSWFRADKDEAKSNRMFWRATFAAAASEQMDEAMRRFGAAVREVFGLNAKSEAA
ncbi:MAG: Aromatic/aminoadipate aminotransferase 1 [Vezdaea aestivalis]|nr:MAG: Aromatic/aminoadipate aminotransferase 1 [Vezdaea aestivalis]